MSRFLLVKNKQTNKQTKKACYTYSQINKSHELVLLSELKKLKVYIV